MNRVLARVLLVGFEDQDNLGLRYLSARLKQAGHQTRIVTVSEGGGPILEAVRDFQPHVVGFSLIFQYLVPEFAEILKHLRQQGVSAHFTMGGHYASFEYQALMETIPELDTVVRFEGEDTLLELSERVASRMPFTDVAGISFRTPAGVSISPSRKGLGDLDALPWPDREDIQYESQNLPTASVLGSRGCPWKCSFCSIITFYEGNGTRGRRRRNPARVVDELEHLHRERGVSVILWQDDDFLAGGKAATQWAHKVARDAISRGLHHRLRWKFSCRSDEIKKATLEPLVEAGLTHVYLGVESGDPDNLKNLNKLLKPEVHLQAAEVLDDLGVSFDFGFMLLEPWSTLATVQNNLTFLRAFAGNGRSTVGFCRMLPYVGTAVAERLKAEGRLFTTDLHADYNFLDPILDGLYAWLLETFKERNFTASGTQNLLRLLLFESQLKLPDRPFDPVFCQTVRSLTSVSNRLLIDTIESALEQMKDWVEFDPEDSGLRALQEHHASQDLRLRADLAMLMMRRPGASELVHVTR